MLLLIDNYDSFTFNLAQYLGELGAEVKVLRNDAVDVAGVARLSPSHIVLSPGPGDPDRAGITLAVIRAFAGRIPMLGVCLGHQAIGRAFGGRVVHAARVVHGKADEISHDGRGVFRGLPGRFRAGRYHSLALELASLPDCLEASAHTADGELMGLRHRQYALEGVQFHPESVLTEHGKDLLNNFLR